VAYLCADADNFSLFSGKTFWFGELSSKGKKTQEIFQGAEISVEDAMLKIRGLIMWRALYLLITVGSQDLTSRLRKMGLLIRDWALIVQCGPNFYEFSLPSLL
jgi:hypothetical protein